MLEFSFFLFLYFKSLYQTGQVTVRNSFLFSAAVSSERERSWGARENRKGLGRDRGIERTLMMVSLVCVYPFDSSNLSSLSFHIYSLPLNLQLSAILPKRYRNNRCPLSPPSLSSLTAKVTSSVDLLRSLPSRLVFLRIFPEKMSRVLHSMGGSCDCGDKCKSGEKTFENSCSLCKTGEWTRTRR